MKASPPCDSMVAHLAIMAQAASKREKCAASPSTRVSLSNNHRGHRQVTMTTTSDDNDYADQEDIKMEEDDLTPHQSHLGTETTENLNEFHKLEVVCFPARKRLAKEGLWTGGEGGWFGKLVGQRASENEEASMHLLVLTELEPAILHASPLRGNHLTERLGETDTSKSEQSWALLMRAMSSSGRIRTRYTDFHLMLVDPEM